MSADQRANYRVSIRQEGQLRLGRQTYACAIENESAGGFAAKISVPLHFDRGQQMELLTDGGVTVVKVARCKISADGTTVGLERVKDLASKKELDNASWSIKSYCSAWRRRADGITLGTIAAVCIFCIFGCWGVVRFASAMMPGADRGAGTKTAFGEVSATYVVESRRNLQKSFEDYLDKFHSSRTGQSLAGNNKVQENYARFVRQRLLASNQAAIALGLSPEQILTIREAVMTVEDEVVSLARTLKTDEAELADVAHTRLEEAEKAALACLSEDQRLLWATLTKLESPSAGKSN